MKIVLIHGAPCLPSSWEPMRPFLPSDTLAPELRDCRVPTTPATNISGWLDDLAEQCEGLSEPLTLVGHSSGAWLALRVAERLPEQVARVVSLSGHAEEPESHAQEMLGFAEALESGALTLEAASDIACQRWLVPSEKYEAQRAAARQFFEEMGVTCLARSLRRTAEMSEFPELRVKAIPEVVVIHGTSDQAVPLEWARAAERAAKSYREVLLDTASHFLQWSHPEDVAAAIVASGSRSTSPSVPA